MWFLWNEITVPKEVNTAYLKKMVQENAHVPLQQYICKNEFFI